MKREILSTLVARSVTFAFMLGAAGSLAARTQAQAQDGKAPSVTTASGTTVSGTAPSGTTAYGSMAPLEQYLMADRTAEIAMARSAAPESISRDAEVMVLGPRGYETAIQGKNNFVCLVERSWTAGIDDPEFWNPRLRGPICFNPSAARSYLPLIARRTSLILAGQSKAQVSEAITAALDRKALPTPEPGAMSYMLSRQGYLGDTAGHWHPHLMFFVPQAGAQNWGANLPGSPVFGAEDALDRLTVFMLPVPKWSDGTAESPHEH